jgi:hypothetical protein
MEERTDAADLEEGECSEEGEDAIGQYTPLERPIQAKPSQQRLPNLGKNVKRIAIEQYTPLERPIQAYLG